MQAPHAFGICSCVCTVGAALKPLTCPYTGTHLVQPQLPRPAGSGSSDPAVRLAAAKEATQAHLFRLVTEYTNAQGQGWRHLPRRPTAPHFTPPSVDKFADLVARTNTTVPLPFERTDPIDGLSFL